MLGQLLENKGLVSQGEEKERTLDESASAPAAISHAAPSQPAQEEVRLTIFRQPIL